MPSRVGQLDLGFSFFYLNRCNRSGIPSGGVIGGINQSGEWKMDARFPRNELIRRIELIAAKRSQITVKNLDAEKFIAEHICSLPKETLVYCDPPYHRKADRLYLNHYSADDHKRLAKVIQRNLKCHWITTYDAVDDVERDYSKRQRFKYSLQYNAATPYKGTEVLILSDRIILPARSTVRCIDAALPRSSS